MDQLSTLNKQIESFITRYYQNQLIKGTLLFTAISVSVFLLIIVLEYFGRFGSSVRAFLLFGFALAFLILLVNYVIVPFSRIMRISKRMDYNLAARIIGKAIPEVKDKLLNTLQLNAMSDQQSDLVIAALKDRQEALSGFSFEKVVDFGFNKRYLKYAIPPVLIIIVLIGVDNSLVIQSASRIVQYQREFLPPAPYQFQVNYSDQVFIGDPFTVDVELRGKEIPKELFIFIDGKSYRMRGQSTNEFRYEMLRVNGDFEFQIKDNTHQSQKYAIHVLSKPSIEQFTLNIDYPAYTGLQDETLKNIGDVEVPEGTKLNWTLKTKHTEEVLLVSQDSSYSTQKSNQDRFVFDHSINKPINYRFAIRNENKLDTSNVNYWIKVKEDKYPVITVERMIDSLNLSQVFLRGSIKDDYGFTALNFVVDGGGRDTIIPIDFESTIKQQEFYFEFNADQIIPNTKEAQYYFLVKDNDRVKGPKGTNSVKFSYKERSSKEKFEKVDDLNQALKSKLDDQLKKSEELNKKFDKFEKDLQQKKKLDWTDKEEFKELLNEKKELMNEIENSKKDLEELMEFADKEIEFDQDILDKQKQLEELFDKVMDDEMKELLEELEKMMENINKEQLQEKLDEINMDNESLEEELDRNLELFKQLEFEQNFEQLMDRLDELQKKQEELAEDKTDSEEQKEKQDSLNKEFEGLKEELDQLEKDNQELEEPNDIDFEKDLQKEIEDDMQESSDQLDQNKKNKASESQNNAAKKMEQMKQQMSQSMNASESEQQEEDMQALRQIMENLLEISFDQEYLLADLKETEPNNPLVVDINKQQKKLEDDFVIVKDSLQALAKRLFQISSEINKEVHEIEYNMSETVEQLAERRVKEGATHQQYVMTSANNLALLLDEIMQQMQQQMSQSKPGQGNCKKPGQGSSPSMSRMKSMQKQLKKQLQQMLDKQGNMKNGKKPGQKPGQKPGMGGQGSQQLAKMAAQQAALRDQLRKLANQIEKEGNKSGAGQLKKIADLMDKNQDDIIRKRITQETLKRQQDIEVKLLESEKALREEGQDNKRESKENFREFNKNDKVLEDYFKKKQSEIELLRKLPVELSPYFKEKNSNYYNQ